MTEPAPLLVTIAYAAHALHCSPRTVRRRIQAGELAAVRDHGRTMIRADELLAYVEALRPVGPGQPRRRPRGSRHDFGWLADNIGIRNESGRAALERPRP